MVKNKKILLLLLTVSGAGVLCFPDTPIMCLRVSYDIDAVIWVKNGICNHVIKVKNDAVFDLNHMIRGSSRA